MAERKPLAFGYDGANPVSLDEMTASDSIPAGNLAPTFHGLTEKETPADNDEFPAIDSAESNVLKKTLWSSIKATLKTYFDTIYAAASHNHSANAINADTLDGDRLPALSTTKKGGVPATGTPSGKFLKDDGSWDIPSGSGSGDVVGPSSAVDSNFASFDTTTGKLIKDSGSKSSDFIPSSEKGAANGVASLGADGKVPSAQLPASSGSGGGDFLVMQVFS